MKKLSIVIPVYNGEQSIGYLLEDVLKLGISNYEVIVVNDGSTDNTKSIIEKYSLEYRLIKLVNQKNLGVSSARNQGIKASNGEYIVFLDADDRIEPLKFEQFFLEALKAGAEYSFTGYNEKNFRTKSEKYVDAIGKGNYNFDSFADIFFDNLKVNLISYPINKIFLKSIIEKHDIKFDETIHFAEDLLFNLDYMKFVDSFYISKCNYYIYQKHFNENSLSSKFNMGFWESRKLVYSRLNLIGERVNQYKLFKQNQDTYAANVIVYTSRQIVNQNKSLKLIKKDLRAFVEDEYLKEIIDGEISITKRQEILFNLFKKKKVYEIYLFWRLFEIKDKLINLKMSFKRRR